MWVQSEGSEWPDPDALFTPPNELHAVYRTSGCMGWTAVTVWGGQSECYTPGNCTPPTMLNRESESRSTELT